MFFLPFFFHPPAGKHFAYVEGGKTGNVIAQEVVYVLFVGCQSDRV